MTREEANQKGREVYEEWQTRHDEIEATAKKNGEWQEVGLDGNTHLFQELNTEIKNKLAQIRALISS